MASHDYKGLVVGRGGRKWGKLAAGQPPIIDIKRLEQLLSQSKGA